jgi:hypothetical protein
VPKILLNNAYPFYNFYLFATSLLSYVFLFGTNPPNIGDVVFILFASGSTIYYYYELLADSDDANWFSNLND